VIWSNGQTGNSITLDSQVSITASAENECGVSTASNIVTISIIGNTPTAPTISANGSTDLCQGQNVVLTATNICNGCNVIWSNGQTGNSITVDSQASISAAAENECGISGASNLIEISFTPYIPIITVNNQCYLAAPSGSNYKWYLNNIYQGDGQFWTAMETGYYTMTMTGLDDCEGISEPLFVEACATSLNEIEIISKFEILPNPVENFVQINFELKTAANWKLELFNISGQLIRELDQANLSQKISQQQYDFSSLNSGVYIVRLVTEQYQINKRIVIAR